MPSRFHASPYQHQSQKILSNSQTWLCPSLTLKPSIALHGPQPKPIFGVFHIPAISPSPPTFVSAEPWLRRLRPSLPGWPLLLGSKAPPGPPACPRGNILKAPFLGASPALFDPLPRGRNEKPVEVKAPVLACLSFPPISGCPLGVAPPCRD